MLPAIAPQLSYKDLVIGDGTLASMAYSEMIRPDTPPERRRKIRANLLAYCERDTLAELAIYSHFVGAPTAT